MGSLPSAVPDNEVRARQRQSAHPLLGDGLASAFGCERAKVEDRGDQPEKCKKDTKSNDRPTPLSGKLPACFQAAKQDRDRNSASHENDDVETAIESRGAVGVDQDLRADDRFHMRSMKKGRPEGRPDP